MKDLVAILPEMKKPSASACVSGSCWFDGVLVVVYNNVHCSSMTSLGKITSPQSFIRLRLSGRLIVATNLLVTGGSQDLGMASLSF